MKRVTLMATLAVSALVAAGLSGCAGPVPGMTRAEVASLLGAPGREVPLQAAGSRLQYSRQPGGQTALMVDLDASGRVTSVRQVLNARDFERIAIGQWTRADMEREFGGPASIDRVASWPTDIMTYRWLDSDQAMFFWVYLDGDGVVQRTGQGMEFLGRRYEND